MFVVLWEFDVKSECEELFTLAYSASGDWARLFATDAKFRSTTLLRKIAVPLRFVSMDVWETVRIMNIFCARAAKRIGNWMRGARG